MGCTSSCRHQTVMENFLKKNPKENYGSNEDFDLVLQLIEQKTVSNIAKLSRVQYYKTYICPLTNNECQAWLVYAEFEDSRTDNYIWTVKSFIKDKKTVVEPGNTTITQK